MKTDIEHAVEEARLARISESELAISSRRSSFKSKQHFKRTFSGRSQFSGMSMVKKPFDSYCDSMFFDG